MAGEHAANAYFHGMSDHHYDAIVVGSGMSGGWAAKELCEFGLKTLVLERGREVRHNMDYPTTNLMPWEFAHRGDLTHELRQANPVVSRCYAFREDALHFFVKDDEHPYVQEKPFDWIRGYQTGGKSLMWARQTQRWSQYDFDGPARDGFAVPWPIGYADVAPWYSHVERFVGISGNRDGIESLPDGEFLPALEMNCVEKHFQQVVRKHYPGRHVIYGRCAHLTEPQEIHLQQGRARCQHRNLCQRGCPFGGYFSSVSATLPWAARTGKLTMVHQAVVHSVIYDEAKQRATGVRVIDAETKAATEYFAPVIFLCAATLNTNLILLNSRSNRFPDGLGNDNGLLGTHMHFHNYRGSVSARYEKLRDRANDGRTMTASFIPRFRNVYRQETDFLRGYSAGFYASRGKSGSRNGFGESLKQQLDEPAWGDWRIGSQMQGEVIPKASNRVYLHSSLTDAWGIPQLVTAIGYDDNDEKMLNDYRVEMAEMFDRAGFTDIQTHDSGQAPGLDIHEMGGVRMGGDPGSSLLNRNNQLHACPNVYVTDGACMTSAGTQNPSLTFMALTARAAHHAADSLKKGEL